MEDYRELLIAFEELGDKKYSLNSVFSIEHAISGEEMAWSVRNRRPLFEADELASIIGLGSTQNHRDILDIPGILHSDGQGKLICVPTRMNSGVFSRNLAVKLFGYDIGQIDIILNKKGEAKSVELAIDKMLINLPSSTRLRISDKSNSDRTISKNLRLTDLESGKEVFIPPELRAIRFPDYYFSVPRPHTIQVDNIKLEFMHPSTISIHSIPDLARLAQKIPLDTVVHWLSKIFAAGGKENRSVSLRHIITFSDKISSVIIETDLSNLAATLGFRLDPDIFARRYPKYERITRLIWGKDRSLAQSELWLSSLRPIDSDTRTLANLTDFEILMRFFDRGHYISKYGEFIPKGMDPAEHYIVDGRNRGYTPHPLFFIPETKGGDKRAYNFIQFIRNASSQHHHPLFWADWYRSRYDLGADDSPWLDYVLGGWAIGREPNPFFIGKMVPREDQSADDVALKERERSPLAYCLSTTDASAPAPHPFARERKLDCIRYVSTMLKARKISSYPYIDQSVYRDGDDVHYLTYGESNYKKPNFIFDPKWYRKKHRYASELLGPLMHYLTEGQMRGFAVSPLFDTRYYSLLNQDVILKNVSPMSHFLVQGAKEPRRRPSPRFHSTWYAANAPAGLGSLQAFMTATMTHPIAPHPALSTSARATQEALLTLITADDTDQAPLPFGVRSLFGGTTSGAAVREIDAYERDLDNWRPSDSAALRLTERVRTQYEAFDDRKTPALLSEARKTLAGLPEGPLVTVIMPVRNRASIISSAIRSVLAQSYKNLELLVVDDGSTDGTPIVARGVGDSLRDSRLKVISIPASGVSAARNVGLEAASGEYISYLDSDNTWLPDHITILLGNIIANTHHTLAHAALRIFSPNGTIRYRGEKFDQIIMSRENFIDMNVLIHHRRVIDSGLRFDETLLRCVDWDFIYRSCEKFGHSHYVPVVGCNYLDDSGDIDRITTNELVGDYYRLASRQIDLSIYTTGSPREYTPEATIIWPIHRHDEIVLEGDLWTALHHLKRGRHELIVVANALSDRATGQLVALSRRVPGFRVIHLPRSFMDTPAASLAVRLAQGPRYLFWSSQAHYEPAKVARLIGLGKRLQRPLTFPVLVDEKDCIRAGLFTISRSGDGLIPVMSEQQRPRDIHYLTGVGASQFPVLIDAEYFHRMGGFDFLLSLGAAMSDFVIRSWDVDPDSTRVVLDLALKAQGRVIPHGTEAGRRREQQYFQTAIHFPSNLVIDTDPDAPRKPRSLRSFIRVENNSVHLSPQALPLISRRTRPGGLRIQINCPAPDNETKYNWGDLHYAECLAQAFAAAGQTPTICLRDHWGESSEKQDVVLHIRGIVDIKIVPHAINLVWVISHPEKPTAAEFERVDMVIASSDGVAKAMYRRFDMTCPVLPQATDPSRFGFQSGISFPELQNKLLFVGNSRRQHRHVIMDAFDNGLPLEVYGRDWEPYLSPETVKGYYLPNSGLAGYYRSAGVVLNDHWSSMAQHGIISNRLYDVVGCGGVAISDKVEGIADIFGDHVKTVGSAEELVELANHIKDWAPADKMRLDKSKQILSDHSFDRRAHQILALINEI
ncbi:glycosyltransferase (plasmid) [Segnochrobactraceae bacterium EtOH-i3]